MKKSEKRTIGVMIGSIIFLLGAGLWWNQLNAAPNIDIPTKQLPDPNAHDYYVKAAQLHSAVAGANPGSGAVDPVTDGNFDPKWTPQQIAQRYPTAGKVAWVKKNAAALQTLRQGFAYEYMEPTERSMTALYPHYAQFRSLARFMIIESHSRSEQGDWAGASRSTLDMLRMSNDIPRGGSLIGALVGYAIGAMGRKELQIITPHLNAAAARAAAARIEALEAKRVAFADTLQEEKWATLSTLQKSMQEKNWRVAMLRGSTTSWMEVARLYSYSKHKLINNYAGYMDARIAEAKRPYLKRQTPKIPNDPLSQILLPAFARAQWNAARDETGNVTLMVQLALRAFQLEQGRLPDTLTELTPSYLKKVPHDPFGGGEALRYAKTGKSYLLYSIASDGKDDGGKPIDNPGTRAGSSNRYLLQPDSTGDYVAGINR